MISLQVIEWTRNIRKSGFPQLFIVFDSTGLGFGLTYSLFCFFSVWVNYLLDKRNDPDVLWKVLSETQHCHQSSAMRASLLHAQPARSGVSKCVTSRKFLSPFSFWRKQLFPSPDFQDQIHNWLDTVCNKNVGILVQKLLRILKQWE